MCVYVLQDLNAQLDEAESEIARGKEKISTLERQLREANKELEKVRYTCFFKVCIYTIA